MWRIEAKKGRFEADGCDTSRSASHGGIILSEPIMVSYVGEAELMCPGGGSRMRLFSGSKEIQFREGHLVGGIF